MTTIQLTKFRSTLNKEQAVLAHGRLIGARDLAIEPSADELDRIQSAQIRDLTIKTLDRDAKRMHEVRSALFRLEAGTFGMCIDCEEPIGDRRLTAIPWIARCILCQDVVEQEQGDRQAETALEDSRVSAT